MQKDIYNNIKYKNRLKSWEFEGKVQANARARRRVNKEGVKEIRCTKCDQWKTYDKLSKQYGLATSLCLECKRLKK